MSQHEEEGFKWWCPVCWLDRWKARRTALKAMRKAINAANDLRVEQVRWYRQNLVRVVMVEQGNSTLFEVQWRANVDKPWQLAEKSYGRATANWDADNLAEHLWQTAQPKRVQVVG